ncbi:histidine kinase dimerization/phosphoacceptor domain -containing protein [Pigmentiphaga litoralis]|uniref:histidine kinase dimerization/phosphoacceptor domain -containing protein n=1 Tax=Pigmentiphaga litoralis TaxID=516702 RepID=UPI003B4286DA
MNDPAAPQEVATAALSVSSARLKRQHELAVEFAIRALKSRDVAWVIDGACQVVAQGLNARFVKVLRYQPESGTLLLEAGTGWAKAEIGTTTLSADDASPAGHAYRSVRPVISNHLGAEHRFRTPDLLLRYGIKRAVNVPIRGVPEPYGILEADSPDDEDFSETDLVFLEAVANVISMTRERVAAEVDEHRQVHFSETVLNASMDCIKVMTVDGRLEFMNEHGLAQMEIDAFESVRGRSYASFWPDDELEKVHLGLAQAADGVANRFEGMCRTDKGASRWWDVSLSPIRGVSGEVERIVSVARDISERHAHEEQLNALVSMQETKLYSSELMMKEVHHRVRNSLQLVQTLLALQGDLSGDTTVSAHLQVAATRVMTVGSVHQRLYEESGVEATDAGAYLSGLIGDLQVLSSDRRIVFASPGSRCPRGAWRRWGW